MCGPAVHVALYPFSAGFQHGRMGEHELATQAVVRFVRQRVFKVIVRRFMFAWV
jgi:hypothetical protein